MKILPLLACLFCLCSQQPTYGCTGLKLSAKDGSIVHGRTFEFGLDVPTSIAFIPRNYEFKTTTSNGKETSYLAKYAAIGTMTFDSLLLLDGMNEKGLAAGTFYFPGFAGYANFAGDTEQMLFSPTDFPNWIITQFATLEEVKEAVKRANITPTVIEGWGSQPPPFHYIVYDKSGKSIVIEPIDGKLIVHDNPFGVITNSPTFDWHLTNLRNYLNLHPVASNAPVLGLTPLGQGIGLQGMPGDFLPPSRFVRAWIYSSINGLFANSEHAVFHCFHILNQFDIPYGSVVEADTKLSPPKYTVDHTLMTVVRDPNDLAYYFKTFDNQTIRKVDFSKFDFEGSQAKKASTESYQTYVDITSKFEEVSQKL